MIANVHKIFMEPILIFKIFQEFYQSFGIPPWTFSEENIVKCA